MAPILDGTADTGSWQQRRSFFLLSFPVRVTVLLAILGAELVALAVML